MSGGDLSLDMAMLGRVPADEIASMKNKEQFALRSKKGVGDGAGLLIIYPISRWSPSKPSSKVRRPMAEVLEEIDSGLVREGAPPLFGIGLVTPFDIDDKLRNRGTYVAVRPSHVDDADDDVEGIDVAVTDDERDFAGERR